ncbi:Sugar transferase involved in LPS biosynthesis (colanic, teichoic acid) [Chitinophaga sp. CF118]|uniref:sugar transferase n=1 Tax=Chitinophaga sp. CF118 TaxID=1884367 RepID=UPI0008F0392B|nr:sugar transferase [Chitinophaga sp. CF118]SFD80837.1 Sugar transferase involved in LPS biosynthesis (colanic, teichoic acid) [Chitinophaga sp. CF118]
MKGFYKVFFKRVIDIIVSFIALVIALPVLIVVWIILYISYNKNPFFRQYRPGKNGKIFSIIKFKTMNDRRDAEGNLLPDVERLTSIGKFIRKTSLDEIPQLLNVIMGDMSIIGPRPLLVEYLPLYNSSQQRRHDVQPGITGWAQVNGRNAISWEQKFEYDVWYVDHVSFLLDIKIIWMTIFKVTKSEGINAAPSTTMEKFRGTSTINN